jgi:hypothetical protein
MAGNHKESLSQGTHREVKMMQYSLKNRYALLFLGILLLIMILCPVLCLADAEKIFKENNKAVVIVIA